MAATKSNFMGDPCQQCSGIFRASRGKRFACNCPMMIYMQTGLDMFNLLCVSWLLRYTRKRNHPQNEQLFPLIDTNITITEEGGKKEKDFLSHIQLLPIMPVSQMARSSCMGTRVASCRTASHWSYWKTSARPGPCRCANGLPGCLGLSNGASNFSPNHIWRRD